MSNTAVAAMPQAQPSGYMVPLTEIERAAQYIAKSGMFGVKTVDQAAALMLVAQSEGIHYARAALCYDVIQGRPSLKTSEAVSRYQASGGKIVYKTANDNVCEADFTHPNGSDISIKWDMERAKKAGLVEKDNWKKYPAQMLRARTCAEGVRASFPQCLNGLYTSDEVIDFDNNFNSRKEPLKAEIVPELDALIIEGKKSLETPINPNPTPNVSPTNNAAGEVPKSVTPPQPKWLKPLCEWIKTLKNQEQAKTIIKKYCEPAQLGTLGILQRDKMILELCQKFNEYAPILEGEGGENE